MTRAWVRRVLWCALLLGGSGASAQSSPDATPAAPAPAGAEAAQPVEPQERRPGTPEQMQLGTTQILGNQELPRVLYILPWKRPEMGDGLDRPGNSLIDEALEPLDRVEFRRQLRYRDSLEDKGEGE